MVLKLVFGEMVWLDITLFDSSTDFLCFCFPEDNLGLLCRFEPNLFQTDKKTMENLQDMLLEHVVPDQVGMVGKVQYSFTE